MIKRIPQWVWGVVGAVLFAVAYVALTPVPPVPQPEPIPSEPGVAGAMGWVDRPAEVLAFAATLEFPRLAETPAGQVADDELPATVYLWDAFAKLHGGEPPPPQNQESVGSCVAFGTARAIERTLTVQIAFRGRREVYKRLAEEVIYAGSRVEVGGGRISGDGSVGSWAAKWARTGGFVDKAVHGRHDLTTYNETRCRAWGRSGVPDDLEPAALKHLVKDVTQVKSWGEAKRAMASGYGIAVCSNVGFRGMKRDSRGVLPPSGRWAHCMCLDGYHAEPDGSEYGHIENSWGASAHTGPVGWGSPSTAGFWTTSATIDRMLKQGDSWAFADATGFPARKIDWFATRDKPMPAVADRPIAEPLFASKF